MRLVFFLFALFFLFKTGFSEVLGKSAKVSRVNNPEDLRTKLKESSHGVLIFYLDNADCEGCKSWDTLMKKMATKLDKVVSLVSVDCSLVENPPSFNILKPCFPIEANATFPRIHLFQPAPTKGASPNLISFKGNSSEKELFAFIEDNIPAYRHIILNQESFDDLMGKGNLQIPKVILFTAKFETPYIVKGLSAAFKDKLEFFICYENVTEVVQHLEVEIFPTLVVLAQNKESGSLERHPYEGAMRIGSIAQWLNQFVPSDIEAAIEYENVYQSLGILKGKTLRGEVIDYEEFTVDNWEKVLNRRGKMFFLHITDSPTVQHPLMPFLHRSYKDVHTYLQMMVDKRNETQVQFIRDHFTTKKQLPLLVMYPLGELDQKKKFKEVYDSRVSLEAVQEDLDAFVPDRTLRVDTLGMGAFVDRVIKENKFAAVLLHRDRAPLVQYRMLAMSSEFGQFIDFAHFKDPHEKVLEYYNVTEAQLPKMLIIYREMDFLLPVEDDTEFRNDPNKTTGNIRVYNYQGEWDLSDVKSFFDSLIFGMAKKNNAVAQMPELKTFEDFARGCLETGAHFCLIGVFSLDEEKYAMTTMQERFKALHETKVHYHDLNISTSYVNADCQHEFMRMFDYDLDMLPSVILYFPENKQIRYSRFRGKFEKSELIEWFSYILVRSGVPKFLPSHPVFDDVCAFGKEKKKQKKENERQVEALKAIEEKKRARKVWDFDDEEDEGVTVISTKKHSTRDL